jgi:hypothetical protein
MKFQYIIDILYKIRKEQYTILNIKDFLFEEYIQLFKREKFISHGYLKQ